MLKWHCNNKYTPKYHIKFCIQNFKCFYNLLVHGMNFVTLFCDRALVGGHKLIFQNFCHVEIISFGSNFIRLLSFWMIWTTVPQLQDCRILFRSPSQPMGSFSKKIWRVTMLSEDFFQKKVMCWQRKKLKVKIIANYLLRFGCTHRLHTYFISFSASKTWKTNCFQPLGSFLKSTVMQHLW